MHVYTYIHIYIYIYIMEYYSDIKMNEILSLVSYWIDLEGIMLRELSQTKKEKYYMMSLKCRI